MSTFPPPGRTPDVEPSALRSALDLGSLRRRDGDDRQAYDAADLLLLDTAAAWLETGQPAQHLTVLDDRWGALTLPLIASGHTGLRSAQDSAAAEQALAANARRTGLVPPAPERIGPEALSAAQLVLMPLPRSLEALADWAWLAAEHADDDVVLLAGGRDKHMTPAMNEVLRAFFDDVVPGRGRSKARVLTARGPRRGEPAPGPRSAEHRLDDGIRLHLVGTGSAYGGAKLDPGSRFLLETLREDPSFTAAADAAGRAVDLGCGNGTISTVLALRHPGLRLVATDDSASAAESARMTVRANGVEEQVEILRQDGLESLEDASERLILVNPPFHDRNAVDPAASHGLFAEAARALSPGGRLYCVWNSHLKHRPALEQSVGPTRQLARNRKFTVTVSAR